MPSFGAVWFDVPGEDVVEVVGCGCGWGSWGLRETAVYSTKSRLVRGGHPHVRIPSCGQLLTQYHGSSSLSTQSNHIDEKPQVLSQSPRRRTHGTRGNLSNVHRS